MMSLDPTSKIALILKSLPAKPGVYRFLDDHDIIIYVGKAKNLKKRVSSYFNKTHEVGKLRIMVPKIRDIQTTVVDSEWEALLLENSMIKQLKPRYNVMLKDDKTYPWIAITKETFPRIFATRRPDREKYDLFGPYASVYSMNIMLETIFEVFPIRNCKYFTKDRRPCLQYQIKKCAAPCSGLISVEEYQNNIKRIKEIIKGNSNSVIKQLYDEMMGLAEKWEFEKAQIIKDKLQILEKFQSKSVVVNPKITQLDVFSIEEDEDSAFVNFLRVVEGAIIQVYTLEMNNKMDKSLEELLLLGILEIQERFGPLFPEILLPFYPDIIPEGFTFQIPLRGDKKKLLDLSQKNAHFYMLEKKKRKELVNPERHQNRILTTLQKDLGMDKLPTHIECFDNSNTQGEEPVAAMVCFINGKPAKKEYRHFIIKTVEGPDDFASMKEVIYRRYRRLLDENKSLPQLIVVDGGKGQLNAAHDALVMLGLVDRIMLIGIAKRLEDIYKVGDSIPLYIDKKSESQLLIQRMRDEVHRFGISHHRKRRSKKSFSSQLSTIPGIGDALSKKLLIKFISVKRIKEASEDDIASVIGKKKAKIVKDYLLQ